MPKISVIVPVYNTEKYLHRCIDSILAQTFTDFELLLIDDGSKDSSGAICGEYASKDSRVRVFHKENGGVSSARNLGLDNAKGEWITFCDSDDYVENYWLDIFVSNQEGVDLVAQGFRDNTASFFLFDGSVADFMEILYDKQLVGYTVLKLFKREIINQYNIKFDENVRFREDEEFVLKYFCRISSVRNMDMGGYNYFMPDWGKKYTNLDSYYVTSSMYKSIIEIYRNIPNYVTKGYLREYIFSLFASFKTNTLDMYYRISTFKKLVGRHILYADEVSLISRLCLYFLPTFFLVPLYRFKAKIGF